MTDTVQHRSTQTERDTCPSGLHEWTEANVHLLADGRRYCRACFFAIGRDAYLDRFGTINPRTGEFEVRRWTRELVIARLREKAERLGRVPTAGELDRRGRARRGGIGPPTRRYPSAMTVAKLFGSFPAGIEAAGLEVPSAKRPRATRYQRKCRCCHQWFVGKRRDNSYCSHRCLSRASSRRQAGQPEPDLVRTCLGPDCGELLVSRSRRARYCSNRCRQAAYARQRRQERNEKDDLRRCSNCGGSLAGKRADARYCSDRCRTAAASRREETTTKSGVPQ